MPCPNCGACFSSNTPTHLKWFLMYHQLSSIPLSFPCTGWFTGIPLLDYYNPQYIKGSYNPRTHHQPCQGCCFQPLLISSTLKSHPPTPEKPIKNALFGRAAKEQPTFRSQRNVLKTTCFRTSMVISGSNRWRYVSTIFLAIFCGDIPLNRPYIPNNKRPFGNDVENPFLESHWGWLVVSGLPPLSCHSYFLATLFFGATLHINETLTSLTFYIKTMCRLLQIIASHIT